MSKQNNKETEEETLNRVKGEILLESFKRLIPEIEIFQRYTSERLKIDAPSEEEIESESYEYGGSEVEQRAFIAGMKSAIELLTKGPKK